MNFLASLFEWLMSLRIFTIVEPHEAGVHLHLGEVTRVVYEGFWFQWPVIDRIKTLVIEEQTVDLPNQTLTTSDGRTITISGTVRYEVIDPVKTLFSVLDYDSSIRTLAIEIIGDVTCSSNFSLDLSLLRHMIHEKLEKEASTWGLGILSVGISDYADTLALRFYQTS